MSGFLGSGCTAMHALKGKTDLPQLPQHGLHLSPSSSELSGLSSSSLGVERGNQPDFIQNRSSRSDQGKEDLVETEDLRSPQQEAKAIKKSRWAARGWRE